MNETGDARRGGKLVLSANLPQPGVRLGVGRHRLHVHYGLVNSGLQVPTENMEISSKRMTTSNPNN